MLAATEHALTPNSAELAARTLSARVPFRSPELPHGRERAVLQGRLPAWLRGELVRVAPAVGATPRWAPAHWFDALGLVFGFALADGPELELRWCTLDCEMSLAAMSGKVALGQFASPNQRAPARRWLQPVPALTDNANVNVLRMGPDWVCMTETPHQLLLEPQTLRVRARVRYTDALSGHSPLAHPIVAGETLTNVASKLGPRSEIAVYRHHVASRTRRRLGGYRTLDYPYIHSFGLTERSALIVDHPLRVRALGLLWSNRGVIEHFTWQTGTPTRLMVIDLAGGGVRCHETDPFFCFHTVHAYETADATVLDLLAYEDASIIAALSLPRLAAHGPATNPSLRRLTIDRRSGAVSQRSLSDTGFEFPQLDAERAAGGEASVVWGAQLQAQGAQLRSEIVRVAPRDGATLRFGEGDYVLGEPVFVGEPGRAQQGQGVLLCVGSCERGATLFVLDAGSLEVIAHAPFSTPLPLGFHGSFQPSAG